MEKITCPNCSHKFDIEGVLAQDIRAQLNDELKSERKSIIDERKRIEEELNRQKIEFTFMTSNKVSQTALSVIKREDC